MIRMMKTTGDGAEVTPNPVVDLELNKTVDNSTPSIGELVTFTIIVSNQGPSLATGVEVTDGLPSGYTFTGFATTQGTYNSVAGVWIVGDIPAGAGATLTLDGDRKCFGRLPEPGRGNGSE